MAYTKKTATDETVVTKTKEEIKLQKELDKVIKEKDTMTEFLAKMQAQIDALEKQASNPIQTVMVENRGLSSKKIKVINLLDHTHNLSTESRGGGTIYTFRKFGDSFNIKADDLEKAVHLYRKSFETGGFYICDEEAIEEYNLQEYYKKFIDQKGIEMIVQLQDVNAVDMFCSLSESLKNSTASTMAVNIVNGKNYDLNLIADIQRRTNIDILSMSEDLAKVPTLI